MSIYSNKCDLYDHFWISNKTEEDVEKEIARTDFYIHSHPNDSRIHRLDIHSIKDVAPYYPYLIAIGAWSKEGRATIVLSSTSFVDSEEAEFIGWDLRDALAEYKRCKRKKVAFDPDAYVAALKDKSWGYRENTEEIARRVARDGLKANINGLFLRSKDKWSRAPLARELSRLGYDDFFIERWLFGMRDKKDIPDWRKED